MKKRLRKKLRTDEFAQYGVPFRVEFEPTLEPDVLDAYLDALIDFAEAAGWRFGGVFAPDHADFVMECRGSAPPTVRTETEAWLAKHSEGGKVRVGPVFDLWYAYWDWKTETMEYFPRQSPGYAASQRVRRADA